MRIVTDSTVFETGEAGDPLPTDLSVTTLSANSVTTDNLQMDGYTFTGPELKCPRLETATLSVQYGEVYMADRAGYYVRVSDSETSEIDCIVPSFADPWEIYLELSNGSGSATDLYFEVGFGPRVANIKCASGKKTTIYLRSCGNSDANTLIVYKVAETSI